MKFLLARLVIWGALFPGSANPEYQEKNSQKSILMADSMKLSIRIGEEDFELILIQNPTTQSILDQIPIAVEFEDFAGSEKIFYPPKKLSKENAPDGAKPSKGDIMYYSPWGDVALFYKDAAFASGLIPMGTVEDIDALVQAIGRNNKATITKP